MPAGSLPKPASAMQLPTLVHPSAAFLQHTASVSERPCTPPNYENHPSAIPSMPSTSSSVPCVGSELYSSAGAWPSCDAYLTTSEAMAQSSSLDKAVCWEDAESEDQVPPAADQESGEVCQEGAVTASQEMVSEEQRDTHALRVCDEAAATPISDGRSEDCFTGAAKPAFYIPEEPIPAELIGTGNVHC